MLLICTSDVESEGLVSANSSTTLCKTPPSIKIVCRQVNHSSFLSHLTLSRHTLVDSDYVAPILTLTLMEPLRTLRARMLLGSSLDV